MISYQGMYELFQALTSDLDVTNLANGKVMIKQGQRKLEALLDIYLTEISRTFTTVTDAITGTSSQDYRLPENFRKFVDLYVTVGTTQYRAELIQDDILWREINSTTTQSTSDFLSICFIRSDRIQLYPIPSSANTATLWYNAFTKPLTQADHITGTITTLANGSPTVTGSDTAWTSGMVGRYFRIDDDGEWYKINAVASVTSLTLDNNYQGVSIATGTEAHTIGQFPITPADTHELPVYYAVWRWALMKKDRMLAREYEKLWKEGVVDAQADWANRDSSQVISNNLGLRKRGLVNPNHYPSGMS